MIRHSTLLAALVPAAFLLLAGGAAAQPAGERTAAKQKARGAAESWLALVDENRFAESWEAAAGLLQKRIRREEWVQKARRLRDSVKVLSARRLSMVRYRNSLRRAPDDGPFVLLKYRSTFAAGHFEELLLAVQRDETWKVTGYQVTPLRSPRSSPPGSTRP
jgi:hypothetical protein